MQEPCELSNILPHFTDFEIESEGKHITRLQRGQSWNLGPGLSELWILIYRSSVLVTQWWLENSKVWLLGERGCVLGLLFNKCFCNQIYNLYCILELLSLFCVAATYRVQRLVVCDQGPRRENPGKQRLADFFWKGPDGGNLNFWGHTLSQNELSLSFLARNLPQKTCKWMSMTVLQ